jgi:hypothetical protein
MVVAQVAVISSSCRELRAFSPGVFTASAVIALEFPGPVPHNLLLRYAKRPNLLHIVCPIQVVGLLMDTKLGLKLLWFTLFSSWNYTVPVAAASELLQVVGLFLTRASASLHATPSFFQREKNIIRRPQIWTRFIVFTQRIPLKFAYPE